MKSESASHSCIHSLAAPSRWLCSRLATDMKNMAMMSPLKMLSTIWFGKSASQSCRREEYVSDIRSDIRKNLKNRVPVFTKPTCQWRERENRDKEAKMSIRAARPKARQLDGRRVLGVVHRLTRK